MTRIQALETLSHADMSFFLAGAYNAFARTIPELQTRYFLERSELNKQHILLAVKNANTARTLVCAAAEQGKFK